MHSPRWFFRLAYRPFGVCALMNAMRARISSGFSRGEVGDGLAGRDGGDRLERDAALHEAAVQPESPVACTRQCERRDVLAGPLRRRCSRDDALSIRILRYDGGTEVNSYARGCTPRERARDASRVARRGSARVR
jgi:hypothetical protein